MIRNVPSHAIGVQMTHNIIDIIIACSVCMRSGQWRTRVGISFVCTRLLGTFCCQPAHTKTKTFGTQAILIFWISSMRFVLDERLFIHIQKCYRAWSVGAKATEPFSGTNTENIIRKLLGYAFIAMCSSVTALLRVSYEKKDHQIWRHINSNQCGNGIN